LGLFGKLNKLLAALCMALMCVGGAAARADKDAPAGAVHKPGQVRKKHTKSSAAQPRARRSAAAPVQKARTSGSKSARSRTASPGARKSKTAQAKLRGQQGIDNERARQIQQALIRERYLDGEPTGTWDQRTKDAMIRFQNDHNWQTKAVPDSRALIMLGLGPKPADLINPQAMSNSPLSSGSAGDMTSGGASARQ